MHAPSQIANVVSWCRKTGVSCGLLLMAVAVAGLWQVSRRSPHIAFEMTEADVGVIAQGDTIHHRFVFSNRGPAPLDVHDVRGDCGCIATLVSSAKVDPGASGNVDVRIDTSGFEGRMDKRVTVATNDPGSTTELHIRAWVKPQFILSDRFIDFGLVKRGHEVAHSVRIMMASNDDILMVRSTDPSVDARLERPPGGSREVRVIATQRADAKAGWHFGNLVISTSSHLTPQLRIPVRGTVTDGT
jgi:hypothetical protein